MTKKEKNLNYTVETIPCLSDNYAFIIINSDNKKSILVDAPEPEALKHFIHSHDLTLEYILLTHHHDDHIQGVPDLVKNYNCKVVGAMDDEHRLPKLDIHVKGNDQVEILNLAFKIFDVPGHTIGHIAFYCEKIEALFSGDSLMALGCGRLFEGTPNHMWNTLNSLMLLPPSTNIYSGHEYTINNANFCLSIEPENVKLRERIEEIKLKRSENRPTIPSTLHDELETNIFLRAGLEKVKKSIGLAGSSDLECFAEIRRRKDTF